MLDWVQIWELPAGLSSPPAAPLSLVLYLDDGDLSSNHLTG